MSPAYSYNPLIRRLLLLLFCTLFLSSCDKQKTNPISEFVPTATLVPSPTLSPTPTPTPSPTPVPLSMFSTMNQEGTLYKIDLSTDLGIKNCEMLDLYNLNGVPVMVYVEAYENVDKVEVKVASFDPGTGEILFQNCFEFTSYLPSSSLVTPDGFLRLCDNGTYTYLNDSLEPVKTLSLGTFPDDYSLYLTDDSEELFWSYLDEAMTSHLLRKNLITGEVTDYSELLTGLEFPTILTSMYYDTILVITASDSETYQYQVLFINVNGTLLDTVNCSSLEIQTYGSKYSALYYHTFPELLLWEADQHDDVICYQYENQNECYNYLYQPQLLRSSLLESGLLSSDILTGSVKEDEPTDLDSEDLLFTVWSQDAPSTGDDSFTSVITTLTCLSVQRSCQLYETKYHNKETIEYLSEPYLYLEKEAYLMGLCQNYNKTFIYLWDLSSAKPCTDQGSPRFLPFIDPENPDPEQLQTLQVRAQEIGERFGVNITTGSTSKTDFDTYLASPAFHTRLIALSLDILEETLEKYPADFFQQLSRDGSNILTFHLVGNLIGQSEDSLESAGAIYCYDPVEQCIAIDCTKYGMLEQNIYHELSHATDWYIDEVYSGNYNEEWIQLNPEDFSYDYTYLKPEVDDTYCLDNDDSYDNDYFIDYYSKTYPTEDRARLAEYSCLDGIETYQQSPHIIEKLELMFRVICDCFNTDTWNGDFFSFDEYFGFPAE